MPGLIAQTALAGAALWGLTQGPPEIKAKLLKYVSEDQLPWVIRGLQGLLGLDALLLTNRFLNRLALNHWQIQPVSIGTWDKSNSQGPAKWDWNKEVAVVTGAASGFGLLLTQNLTQWGVKVAAVDMSPMPDALNNNPRVKFYQFDLRDIPKIEELAKRIESDLGHPTILINNAGVGMPKSVSEVTAKEIDTIFKVNIMCHFELIRLFMPHMRKINKGHIVEIASAASFVTVGMITHYCATKAAVLSLWEGLNQELRYTDPASGVVATVVHPAWANTPMVTSHGDIDKFSSRFVLPAMAVVQPILDQIKSGRGGQIVVPKAASIVSYLRGAPYWVQEMFRDSQTWLMVKKMLTNNKKK